MSDPRPSRRPRRVGLLLLAFCGLAVPAYAGPGETVWTLAGTGVPGGSGDGGQAREAAIHQPRAVWVTAAGGFSWAEPYSHRVRIVDVHGVVRTLGGTGEAGFAGDGGPAVAAKLNFVHTAAPTADGGYLLADTRNSRIREIDASGVIRTVAGNGFWGYAGDGGPATKAQINNPRSVLPLPDGGFLIPDTDNHRIRRVSASGAITTVAGTGVEGYGGDGGPATSARLAYPFAVSATGDGGFLIADIQNQRIRKVSAGGTITTVAGTGVAGFGGDGGPATAARLHDPHDVLALPDGGFLIADTSNERVRRVTPDGVITTIVGDGARGSLGDGGGVDAARVAAPKGLALTPSGQLLIADEQNHRIRFVGVPSAPASTLVPTVSGTPLVGATLTANAGGWSGTGPLIGYRWQRCSPTCSDLAGADARTYAVRSADAGSSLRVVVTATNPAGSATAASAQLTVAGSAGGSSGGSSRPGSPKAGSPGGSGSSGGSGGGAGGSAGSAGAGAGTTWVVRAKPSSVIVAEFVLRPGSTRLADVVRAYGPGACRRVSPSRLRWTWARRGIVVDATPRRPLHGAATAACAATLQSDVAAIRLSDRRWTTSLGLRVGDSSGKIAALYPATRRLSRSASGTGRYVLVSSRIACGDACPGRARFLTAQVVARAAAGRVAELAIVVAASR